MYVGKVSKRHIYASVLTASTWDAVGMRRDMLWSIIAANTEPRLQVLQIHTAFSSTYAPINVGATNVMT